MPIRRTPSGCEHDPTVSIFSLGLDHAEYRAPERGKIIWRGRIESNQVKCHGHVSTVRVRRWAQEVAAAVAIVAIGTVGCATSNTQSSPASTTLQNNTAVVAVTDASTAPRPLLGSRTAHLLTSAQQPSRSRPTHCLTRQLDPLHLLLGPDQLVDVATQGVSAPLVRVDGTVEDVVLEIRSGGPAIGFRDPLVLLDEDPELLLAQVSTAVALRNAGAVASVGVVTLTDRSHDALIVDPATYPGLKTVEAVRDAGIEIRHVTDEPFITFLTATGSLAP